MLAPCGSRSMACAGRSRLPDFRPVRYGGNTVCVDVRLARRYRAGAGRGTGIRELGRALLRESLRTPIHGLITHAHWDHIIGLPFFGPIWRKDSHLVLYPLATAAQERLRHQSVLFEEIHFPVRAADIPAKIELVDAPQERWRIGSRRHHTGATHHPGAPRDFESRTSMDPVWPISPTTSSTRPARAWSARTSSPPSREESALDPRRAIHRSRHAEQTGLGHSLVSDVLELGCMAEAATVALFHHEPERDDEALDRIGVAASAWLMDKGSPRRPWWLARD